MTPQLTFPQRLLRSAVRASYYPSLWFSQLMTAAGRWNWWDAVDEHVLIGAVPSILDLQKLRDLGVGGVINLCDEFRGHDAELARLGLAQLCLPTLDYFPPDEADIRRGLSFIAEQIARGKKVYVHCKAGRGRSATLALCYLMVAQHCTAAQAYARLRAVRPQISHGLDQRDAVLAIERAVSRGEWSATRSNPAAAATPTSGSK